MKWTMWVITFSFYEEPTSLSFRRLHLDNMELQGGFRLEDSNTLCRKIYSQKVLKSREPRDLQI